ncbi:transglutaminase-like domain-containing protein [Maribellus mangrovi]|uniref:transglutaminase-like domain-containing protein n=1 Tax=Maribellus mangrovi TaxID=3133146 RepID=UPI0030ED3275
MRTIDKFLIVLAVFTIFVASAAGQSVKDLPEYEIFAVEINGVLCGYAESEIATIQKDGRELLVLKRNILAKLSVLGGGVDMKVQNEFLIDPETDEPVSTEHVVATSAEVYAFTKFESGKAYFTNSRNGELRKIELEDEVVVENSISYPHLMRDFIEGAENEKTYWVFDDIKGVVASKTYKRIGTETLELIGKEFNTTVLEEVNHELGTVTKLWLENEHSFLVKLEVAGRNIYLADESVKKKIQTVDMESMLFAKVDKMISNVPDISYMKVEAKIVSGGEWITAESLNFTGQKFVGTVTNNLIEGIFEIEKQHYYGKNASDFPSEFNEEELKKYLDPESLIESDHPVLVVKAKQITEGSENTWDAVVKLSTWVGENIHGAVPGGTSAINTYNTREGECGSHSRLLAAFCRAVGIPARLSIGCMYTPYLGGSFGQHAWTEVYMGDDGWVAVDATAQEFNFVDAGHIRLGESTSFNPKEMKILEYKLGSGDVTLEVPEELQKYIGKYIFEERNATFEILYQDGSLTVNIPDGPMLALDLPDENGVFYPKMTRQLNFSFENDLYGNIAKMKLQQVSTLGKKFEQDSISSEVPEEIRPLVGNYWFAQAQADFKVFYENGLLKIKDPLAQKVISLPEKNAAGLWMDEFGKNEIEFLRNEKGEVVRMLIYSNVYLKKQVEL